jgi:hypothetical protein
MNAKIKRAAIHGHTLQSLLDVHLRKHRRRHTLKPRLRHSPLHRVQRRWRHNPKSHKSLFNVSA